MERTDEGAGLRVDRHNNAAAPALRSIRPVPPAHAIAPASSIGCSNAAGASPSPPAALSARSSGAAIRSDSQRTSLGIHEIKFLLARRFHAHLEEWARTGSECDTDLHGWCISTSAAVLAIAAVATVSAISSRRRIVWIHGTHASTETVDSIRAVETAGARAAGEICREFVVVARGNVEIGAKIWMAWNCNRYMPYFSIANPGIPGEGNNAFLAGSHYTRSHFEVLPHHLPLAFPFRGQHFAVQFGECHHEGRFLTRRDSRAFWKACLHGRKRRLVQFDLPSQADLQG